ncbi:MAG: glycoside hydrolase family 9 protein [Paludibacter sp.]|nr:glycoside hydrolase family 9 protein [Paludibacter sp.]
MFFKQFSPKYLSVFCLLLVTNISFSQKLQINEKEYFEKLGVNIFVYNNQYAGMFFDEKTAGIEIIHHGVRTATGGAVRLQHTPEQWDLIPIVVSRTVDKVAGVVNLEMTYKEFDFNFRISVKSLAEGVQIELFLDKPIPKELEGKAGFNLEFLPTAYFGKSYFMDSSPYYFPKYPAGNTTIEAFERKVPQFSGHNTFDDRGKNEFIVPKPLATGKTIILAPEDPERRVKIQSADADLMLLDGRNLAQNGWFVVRSLLPANKTGKVLTWILEPNGQLNWKRNPVIAFSQVGYVPHQDKVAVIELDKSDKVLKTASLFEVSADGKSTEVLKENVQLWGQFLRYNYAKFNFSKIKKQGIYYIAYGNQKTNTFAISPDVYKDIWHPTMDVWFPVQMDHMAVNEAYRVWHGAPYLDDCLQAPVNTTHFDGYEQGATTDTKYKSLERIPGMAVGGWFDAGDFDIQTGSHNSVVSSFVETWEQFKVSRDQTFIDQKNRYVDMHRPDGKPDLLQQIEHGTLNLVAQCENIGHPVRGIIVPKLHQYHHIGDAVTETDNLPYNPNLKPYESDGISSGTLDDRWAFTNRSSMLDYQTAATLAAASRALRAYNDDLANRSLASAIRLVNEADERAKNTSENSFEAMFGRGSDVLAVLQLYITTKDKKYADRYLENIWPILERMTNGTGWSSGFFASFGGRSSFNQALMAIPYLDEAYKSRIKTYALKYKEITDSIIKNNPYGVPVITSGWGGSSQAINWSITNYFVHKAFPDIIDKESVFRGLNYVLGCHPYSNLSFVSSVGTESKKVAYGNNRGDFTAIPGGVVPGLILLKPDYLENKDDWPFFWGENECIIDGGAWYVFLANAVNDLVSEI